MSKYIPSKSVPGAMDFLELDTFIPAGAVLPYSANSTPTGWLPCDGREVSRSTYPELNSLYSADGYPWGNGNGSSTFNLPDFRGVFPRGTGAHGNLSANGGSLGNEAADSTARNGLSINNDTHNHGGSTPNGGAHTHTILRTQPGGYLRDVFVWSDNYNCDLSTLNTQSTGSNHSHDINNDTHNHGISGDSETKPASVSVNFIVRAR
jgi:microcystin-dependent protein